MNDHKLALIRRHVSFLNQFSEDEVEAALAADKVMGAGDVNMENDSDGSESDEDDDIPIQDLIKRKQAREELEARAAYEEACKQMEKTGQVVSPPYGGEYFRGRRNPSKVKTPKEPTLGS